MSRKYYDDSEIKRCLDMEADKVSMSDDMFFKIRNEILSKEEKGENNMKFKILNPKTLIIAATIFVLTTVTCVASINKSEWFGSSSIFETKVFPNEDTVNKRVGFKPKYVEEFSNGFKFKSFNNSNKEKRDEQGKAIVKVKNADFYYYEEDENEEHEKNKILSLSAGKIDEQYLDKYTTENVKKSLYKGIEIEYMSTVYKSVPESYRPTQEEQELCDKGLLQIGYGSDEVEVSENNIQDVRWYEDGISYILMNFNYDNLKDEDMINMAKEIIDQD